MKFTLVNKNWLKHLYKHDKPLVKFLNKKTWHPILVVSQFK
jgi:hypothetical protein